MLSPYLLTRSEMILLPSHTNGSLITEEHTPSWILVPDDRLPAHGISAVWMKSLTEQPQTWPGRAMETVMEGIRIYEFYSQMT